MTAPGSHDSPKNGATGGGTPSRPVEITIIVVTFNAEARVAACLEALAGSGAPDRPHEVVVVDNASPPPLRESLVRWAAPSPTGAGHHDRVLLLQERNTGFARACNAAATIARGRVLVLLNPDARPLPGALDALVDLLDEEPRRGIVGGRTLTPEGDVDPASCFAAPTLWTWFADATGLSSAFRRHRLLDPESMGPWQRDDVREVDVVAGCLLAVRRTTWVELCGFDERFVMYGEDADLCRRARLRGYRPAVTPAATAVHARASSSGSRLVFFRLLLRGKATYARLAWPRWAARTGVGLLVAGVGTRALGARLLGTRTARHVARRALGTVPAGVDESAMWHQLWRERRAWAPGWDQPRWDEDGWDPLSALVPTPGHGDAAQRR